MHEFHSFNNREKLDNSLAETVAKLLIEAIEVKGRASLAVSGGSTPKGFFKCLSQKTLAWDKVTITLADERCLDPNHPDSNTRLVHENLLQNKAQKARFFSLTTSEATTDILFEAELVKKGKAAINNLLPLDVLILGMGEDGHTASLFPCSAQIKQAMKVDGVDQENVLMKITPKTAPYQRITFTLASLMMSKNIFLHICGESKKQVLDKALDQELNPDFTVMPISAFLKDQNIDTQVYWAQQQNNGNNMTTQTKHSMNKAVVAITERIIERSRDSRSTYLAKIEAEKASTVHRASLSCGNLAHGFAACGKDDKATIKGLNQSDIAIISAYNDMLSAHQPYENYPQILKKAISETGGVAQFAAGVPAMCDGVTQGQPGMDLSLMSRDVIAMSAAIGLSHNMFDGALMLGICDKIVPGLLIASMTFGHLPIVFVPAGPMSSGLSNDKKAKVRQQYAKGEVDQDALLEAESASYHSAGTCTFFGTANSNQLVVEVMGLHLPGASFVSPNSPLREALTKAAGRQVTRLTQQSGNYMPVGKMVDERSIVNAIVALLATGGSTNLTMHIIAFARAAGIIINYQDFNDLSQAVPLITRIYPNGHADINHFQQAGGMALLFKELIEAGLLHEDVETICGKGLTRYTQQPILENDELRWVDGVKVSGDSEVITTVAKPFKRDGGLKILKGNMGVSILKTSSLHEENLVVKAPAVVFDDQHALVEAFQNDELNKDFIAVIRFQGPKARGMPELHKLTPPLGVLQDKGFKVGLVTDGRMSGASGKVPAAIHLCPEALDGGLIAKIKTGDMLLLDGEKGQLTLLVDDEVLAQRNNEIFQVNGHHQSMGRELFGFMRKNLSTSETGACSLFES